MPIIVYVYRKSDIWNWFFFGLKCSKYIYHHMPNINTNGIQFKDIPKLYWKYFQIHIQ